VAVATCPDPGKKWCIVLGTRLPEWASRSAVVAGASVAVSLLAGCGGADPEPDAFGRADAERAIALVDGVRQSGNTLGDPDAPGRASLYVRLTEPDAHIDRDLLPAIVERYVRTGRLRIQLRTVATDDVAVDGGAEASARVAQGAGLQRTRMWQFALAFRAVGVGTADRPTLVEALRFAGVRDAGPVLAAARSTRVTSALERVDRRAASTGVEPPELVVARGADVGTRIPLASEPSARSVVVRLDRALQRPQPASTSR
jgi:hypothetical protein